MININAESISRELLDILSKETYHIHSGFESGLNIKIGNTLSFIGNKSNTQVPYGVLLKERDVDKLMWNIDRASTTFIWHQEEESLVSSNITINYKYSKKYSSILLKPSSALTERKISLIKDNIDLSLRTGFDLTIEELINQKAKEVSDLQECFMSTSKEEIGEVLKSWIGRGRGLTPSGDDFLQGILVINHLWTILSSEFLSTIEDLMEQELTTDISKNYFICALSGMFTQPIIELYKSMEEKNGLKIKRSVTEILKFGHTSGIDIIAGMYVGINTLQERYKLYEDKIL